MPRQRKHMTPAEACEAGFFPCIVLRQEFRLRPGKNQQPAGTVWQGHSYYNVFDKATCVPMRPYRAPSPAQAAALAAGRKLVGTVLCASCGKRVDADWTERGLCFDCHRDACFEREREIEQEARARAAAWLLANPLFLDTETTGLDDSDQVCEIAVLNVDGTVLFASLVRPGCPMNPEAAAVHGITPEELAQAPTWPDVLPTVAAILAGCLVITHNADFDARLLSQTCRAYGLEAPPAEWNCTMTLLTPLNEGRWPRLDQAASIAGVNIGMSVAHRAVRDADTVRQVVLALGQSPLISA